MAARHKHRLQCQTINKQNKQPCKASGILTKKELYVAVFMADGVVEQKH